MKKNVVVLILLACIAAGAFAQGFELSAGGGALLDYSAKNGVEINFLGANMFYGINNLSFGAYFFGDAKYVEADLNFAFGKISSDMDTGGFGESGSGEEVQGSAVQLGFSLLGKYPFDLGTLTVFPLLGFDYNRVLSLKDGNIEYTDAGDLSQFGILAGGGLDYDLSPTLYLRGELLFHLRLASKIFKDLVSDSEGMADTTMGKGARVKVGVGYRF